MSTVESVCEKLRHTAALRTPGSSYCALAVRVGVDTGIAGVKDPSQPPAFPRQIEQVEAAIEWAQAHAEEYGGDPNHILLFGGSAGAHLALYAALRWNHKAGSKVIRAAVGMSGPYDLTKMPAEEIAEEVNTEIQQAANITKAEVEAYVAGTLAEPKKKEVKEFLEKWSVAFAIDAAVAPKIQMWHGEKDGIVPFKQMEDTYAALIAAGVTAEQHLLVGVGGHAFGTFGSSFGGGTVGEAIDAFLKAA